MTTKSEQAAAGQAEPAQAGETLWRQLGTMVRAFMANPERYKLFLLAGGLAVVIGGTALAQIWLNAWNRPFYDALAQRNLAAFMDQLGVFAVIAGVLLALNVAQTWLTLASKLKLREGLTRDLFGEWLQPGRAFRMSNAGEIGVNPDQRLHDDARNLTELTAELGVGLLQSTLLLLSFIGVLWGLSRGLVFHWRGASFEIPGYLVWCALFYSATASLLGWWIGRPLIRMNAERYGREADLRFSLVRASEHADSIALYGGETDEERRLRGDLDKVIAAMWRIVWATTRLRWVTAGYGWFTLIAPILVAAPAYFQGSLSFGELMMAAGAFTQVQGALRWFVDNFSVIADWRATLVRVASFRQALARTDRLDGAAKRIEIAQSADGRVAMKGLEIATPGGCAALKEEDVTIDPGERVAIVGAPSMGKTMLFRAIAGLWPWGAGRIELPPREEIAFLPRRPYVPPGTLKAALAYPSGPDSFEAAEQAASLEAVGLGRLVPDLERNARWDRELSEEDQQALAFARLLLHKPKLIVADDALDTLDPAQRKAVIAMLRDALKDAAIVNIGRSGSHDGLFTRVVHLDRDPGGRSFAPERHVRVAPRAAKARPALPMAVK